MQNQTIKCYVTANDPLAVVKDFCNSRTENPPVFVVTQNVDLCLRLFADKDGTTAYPLSDLQGNTWSFVLDNDYNHSTQPKVSVASGITVQTIQDNGNSYTEVKIPLALTSQQLITAIGSAETISMNGELVGINSGNVAFVLQIKNFTVRNRISIQ